MKKVVFITGTRADYGKIKSIMKKIEEDNSFKLVVFITGMHMISEYGSTYKEVLKDGFLNTYRYINFRAEMDMDEALCNTIRGFGDFIKEEKPDLIVVHGDRLEALAGAIVGAMNNIYVAHIEGGEKSGTIDESIRHAITKLSHAHFVSNEEAKNRIIQMGELKENIYIVGSPDIDIMLHNKLPSLDETKKRYEIIFERYAIVMFHPVTTSYHNMAKYAKWFVDALQKSGDNYVVILPNNDWGRSFIVHEYEDLKNNAHFKIFPSLRFEYFLSLLKNASYIIGNSSAGVREACVYAVPSVDVGDRQKDRYDYNCKEIIHTEYDTKSILKGIEQAKSLTLKPNYRFGDGNSAQRVMDILKTDKFWNMKIQKKFIDLE